MITKYGTKLTAVGIAKLANAQVTSNKVQITHIAIGDGNGVAYTPTGAETALKRETWRGAVNKAELGENNTIIVEGIVPASVGGFTMREVGLYDADGDMIAVGNYPETERAGTVAGVSNELILRTLIKVNNASAVDLTINTDLTIATKAEMDVVTQQLAQTAEQSLNLVAPTKKKKKPLFSFVADDIPLTDLTKLLPIVREKNAPVGLAVITSKIGDTLLNWADLKEFTDLGCDLLSHTHNHIPLDGTLTDEQIHYELAESKRIMVSNGYNVKGFVYPLNVQSARVRKIVREYYQFAFGKDGRSGNGLNAPKLSNYVIGRVSFGSLFDTPSPDYVNQDTSSLAYYKERVDKAIANNDWLVFMLHTSYNDHNATQQQHMRDIIDYIRSKGYDISSPSEAFEIAGNIMEIGDFSEPLHVIFDREGREDSYDMGVEITAANAYGNSTRITSIPQKRIVITPITQAVAISGGFPDGVEGLLKTYNFGTSHTYRYQEYEQLAPYRKTYRRYVNSNFDWLEWNSLQTSVLDYTRIIASQVVPANSGVTITVSISGINSNDRHYVAPKAFVPTGLVWSAYATNSALAIRLVNVTNADLTLPEVEWNIKAIR